MESISPCPFPPKDETLGLVWPMSRLLTPIDNTSVLLNVSAVANRQGSRGLTHQIGRFRWLVVWILMMWNGESCWQWVGVSHINLHSLSRCLVWMVRPRHRLYEKMGKYEGWVRGGCRAGWPGVMMVKGTIAVVLSRVYMKFSMRYCILERDGIDGFNMLKGVRSC